MFTYDIYTKAHNSIPQHALEITTDYQILLNPIPSIFGLANLVSCLLFENRGAYMPLCVLVACHLALKRPIERLHSTILLLHL